MTWCLVIHLVYMLCLARLPSLSASFTLAPLVTKRKPANRQPTPAAATTLSPTTTLSRQLTRTSTATTPQWRRQPFLHVTHDNRGRGQLDSDGYVSMVSLSWPTFAARTPIGRSLYLSAGRIALVCLCLSLESLAGLSVLLCIKSGHVRRARRKRSQCTAKGNLS